MLACLGHGAVRGSNGENPTVHLGSAGDHVLHIISVAGAVNVAVVAGSCLVLNVRCIDCDFPSFLLGGLVDVLVMCVVWCKVAVSEEESK